MKKLICALTMLFASLTIASAQDYNWAIGTRIGGETAGLSVKYKFNASNAVEALLSAPWKGGFGVTALYERHIPVIGNGFNFYYGAGGHVGDWANRFSIGLDGIVGLEYKLPSVPIAFSLDYKPIFNIAEKAKLYLIDFGLGIKVAF